MSHLNILPRSAARRRPGGFTLVELLVVVGVITVLISLLLPALNKAMTAARAIKCLSNIRQIATAMIMYAQDNKGAMPGVEFNTGRTYWATPYDFRPVYGNFLSSGYPKTPNTGLQGHNQVSWYGNLGLLCATGYMNWSEVLYCPGRDSSDPLSWEGMYPKYPVGGSTGYNTSGGYNPGWYLDGNAFANNNYAGYLAATTNRSADKIINFGNAHRLGRCAPDTPMVLDIFWFGEGATQEGHGKGYNIATFDGSARWYVDPGYQYVHPTTDYLNASTGDVPTWPVELIFQGPQWEAGTVFSPNLGGRGANAEPLSAGWGFPAISSAATNWNWYTTPTGGGPGGSRWVAYCGASPYTFTNGNPPYGPPANLPGFNATSGIPFIEKYLMGWDDQKIENNTPIE